MFTVTITEKGGKATVREFDQPEVSVGRIQGNDIVLAKSNVSKRHVRIVNNDGAFVVIDSKSTNGTYVNGKRIDAPYDLRAGDKIFVGDYTIEIEAAAASAAKRAAPAAQAPVKAAPESRDDILSDEEWGGSKNLSGEWAADWGNEGEAEGSTTEASDFRGSTQKAESRKGEPAEPVPLARVKQARPKVDSREAPRIEPREAPPKAAARGRKGEPATRVPAGDEYAQALRAVHERLLKSLDLRRMDVVQMGDEELRERTRKAVGDIVAAMDDDGALPAGVEAAALVDDVLNEALGLGPLEELLHDDGITEILVNGAGQIFVERQGKLTLTDKTFSSNQAVLGVIERIVAPLGRRIDESSPMVDARLRDGSRVNAIIPPLALKGPTLTIRKFTREPLQIDDLVGFGT
ncbi:MAG: Flp pilus assembly complex ATPase component TadA, partial [Deltaproteobacteria bacterium]|nr:Flp pilus assembly complex ATPase component TadA [Deltaproteobacteria bacterium]